jgi:lipopolysaccharide transport system permease protein
LAWRDILVRYKQTAIGMAWALIRPFLTMVVVQRCVWKFGEATPEGDTPYPIYGYLPLCCLGSFSLVLIQNAAVV